MVWDLPVRLGGQFVLGQNVLLGQFARIGRKDDAVRGERKGLLLSLAFGMAAREYHHHDNADHHDTRCNERCTQKTSLHRAY